MTTNIFNKLNNLKYNKEFLEVVKNYITTNTFPEDIDKDTKFRIKRRFSKNWKVENDNLIYIPLNLVAIASEDKQDIMKSNYDDPVIGIGAGVSSFYNKLRTKYLGIKREDVREFLSNQEVYQLVKQPKKSINKPIVEKKPLGRVAIDLIDVTKYAGHNKKRRYILTGIDYFSRKVFAVGIVNKKPENIVEALEQAFNVYLQGYPKKLQSDNGGEFKNEIVADFCKQHNIKQVFTTSHTPTANGLIENFNLHLRKLMRELFVRTKSFNWLDNLDILITNRNETVHTVTKVKPEEAFNDESLQKEVSEKLKDKAESTLKQYRTDKFDIGEKVRISTSVLSSKLRQKIKAGEVKDIVIKYSTEIYEVYKISKGRKDFAKDRYYLKDSNDSIVSTENNKPKAFFASEILKVKDSSNKVTKKDEEKLNKVQTNTTVEIEPIVEVQKPEKRKRKPNPKYQEE